jgi:hypothetical protein
MLPLEKSMIGLHINSIGEVHRHGVYLRSVSTCNLLQVAEANDLDWPPADPVLDTATPEWREAIRRHFEAERFLHLNDAERALLAKVSLLQEVTAQLSRWRIYGHLDMFGKETIDLSTEFEALVAEEDFWARVDELVSVGENCSLRVMDERRRVDHCWKAEDTPPFAKIEGSDVYGPGHGEMERQVALDWNVTSLGQHGLLQLIVTLDDITQELWEERGVAVL